VALTALVVAGLLALLVFLLLGVVIELQRDVRQLRDATGILDRPLEVDLGDLVGASPSSYGLPVGIDVSGVAIILFLSDRCGTCHALAKAFGASLPAGLWVILEAGTQQAAEEFLRTYELSDGLDERLIVDVSRRIAEQMGVRTTPVGFRVENGKFVSATTVPSRRYLSSILPDRVRLESAPAVPIRVAGRRAT